MRRKGRIKIILTFTLQRGPGLTGTNIVGGSDGVGARVLRDQPDNVHGDVAKVMNGTESVANSNGSSVQEPLNVKVGISKGFNFSLKVSVLTFHQVVNISREGHKLWSNQRLHILLPGQLVMGLSLTGPLLHGLQLAHTVVVGAVQGNQVLV